MNRKITPALAFVAVLAVLATAGCGKKSASQPKSNPTKSTAASPSQSKPSGNAATGESNQPGAQGGADLGIPGLGGFAGIKGLTQGPNSVSPASPAVAASPEVKDVIDRMAAVYKSAKTLKMIGVIKISRTGLGPVQSTGGPLSIAYARPNKLRMITGSGPMGTTIISDGKAAYLYSSRINQYRKGPAPKSMTDGAGGNNTSLTFELLDGRDIYRFMNNAKMLPSQKVGGVDCYVIAYTPVTQGVPPGVKDEQRVWIGKNDLLIHQLQSKQIVPASVLTQMSGGRQKATSPLVISQSTVVKSVVANASLPSSTFRFVPPKGAKPFEMPKMPNMQQMPPAKAPKGATAPLSGAPAVEITGQKAPAFSLASINGSKIALSDYQGKPVLVLFWATMSPQSKKTLPDVEKVYEDLKKSGLGVVGVSLDSNKATVEKFVADNGITFPVAVDYQNATQTAVAYTGGQIGLPAIFVVDKNGVIKGRISGHKSPAEMKAAIEKLGVK